ncbi:MAG TPA: nickel pincer cofactor biosynthesis protein LarB [Stenomitos sp.]
MREADLKALLEAVRGGETSIDEALGRLKDLPYSDLGFAKVDHHRELRTGFPEVVFGLGKTPEQIVHIARSLVQAHSRLLATRISPEVAAAVQIEVPELDYHPAARALTFGYVPKRAELGEVAVLAAGTADVPVAEEAALTAEMRGCTVARVYDVGVAGIHRLFHQRPVLDHARALVVVAGMEGALASVVGGLAARPVIAVPTSVGYGASFGGLAALLAMLNSCVAGVSVVNIDNGFGAGYLAGMIAGST